MFKWTPFPLIRITTALCSGILFGIYMPSLRNFGQFTFCLLLIFGVTAALYFFRKRWRPLKYLIGVASFILLMISGCLLVEVRTDINNPSHIIHVQDSILAYEGIIVDHFDEKKNSFKTTVSVARVKTRLGWIKAIGKINFYFSKESYNDDLLWGDHIIVKGSPKETTPPSNPHEFDYKRFLTFKNIYHQQYVRKGDWIKMHSSDPSILRYSAIARAYFTTIIKKYVHEPQEQAVSLALVIGVVDGIDNDLISAYSASGAMHVLAVSGLHVGILYGIILFFLKPLQKGTRGKWMVSFISLVILWSYAFVTGLSPSVLRAVMMFSFVAIARPLSRRTNIYNTLAGSAFILLILDPYLIMSVGFQLSYLAVLGIIWIQRPLYLLYEAPNRLVDWTWSITCVSIAAQATTFSLGLLYFHQFPTYFLFSNLFVIPVSTFVLVVGIVLLVVSFIEFLAIGIGWLLEKSSWLLNKSVFLVEDLPLSIISDIYIDVFQAWLILGILCCAIFIFQFKKIKWLYVSGVLAIALAGARWAHYADRMSEKQFVAYSVSGLMAFEIIDRGQSYFIADSALLSDNERIRFHIRGNRLFNLVSKTESRPINQEDSLLLIRHNQYSIMFLNRPVKSFPSNINPDWIVISRRGAGGAKQATGQFPLAKLILDGTLTRGYSERLKSRLGSNADKLYSVAETGAWVQGF